MSKSYYRVLRKPKEEEDILLLYLRDNNVLRIPLPRKMSRREKEDFVIDCFIAYGIRKL
ncbi:MAG: hypothetical protein ACLTK7_06065 [Clostridium paraputrificum]